MEIDFKYTGSVQHTTLRRGVYRFECWGASGYNSSWPIQPGGCVDSLARGGYSSGVITIKKSTDFYVYVGQKGRSGATFNSNNKSSGGSGGGASDVRLVGGKWYDFESLKSRIIVAGGGGASERICGGDGGGINGTTNNQICSSTNGQGGTQTSGGFPGLSNTTGNGTAGGFGYGGSGLSSVDGGPFGGSGYYGGGGVTYAGSAGGGSSFISGHLGCDAISESSTEDKIIHTHQPVHYSNLSFIQTITKNGSEEIMNYMHILSIGNEGNGYVRITRLNSGFCASLKTANRNILHVLVFMISLVK